MSHHSFDWPAFALITIVLLIACFGLAATNASLIVWAITAAILIVAIVGLVRRRQALTGSHSR